MKLILAFCLSIIALPVAAAPIYCELPWFARNLIFDHAGHCFSSALGQAVFDNSDCTSGSVELSDRDRQAVAHIEELESYYPCEIDTNATRLEHESLFGRLRDLDVIPAPVEHESGCNGYQGEPLALYSAPGTGSQLLGQIQQGDNILFGYLNEGLWEYVVVWNEGMVEAERPHGWVNLEGNFPTCAQYAG